MSCRRLFAVAPPAGCAQAMGARPKLAINSVGCQPSSAEASAPKLPLRIDMQKPMAVTVALAVNEALPGHDDGRPGWMQTVSCQATTETSLRR
jgi:hypothetical protein